MTDIEGRPLVDNPYAANPSPVINKVVANLQRLIYMGISLYGLRHFNAYQAILRSPHISHEWFKAGIAATIALLGIKAYVEIFEGRMNKRKVDYASHRKSTHAGIAFFLLSSVCYHVALWPHYRWNSFIVLGLAFFGVVMPFLLMTPSWLQNIVSFVLLTVFLQQYA